MFRRRNDVLYTDVDPFVCEWTRNLVEAGHLPPGEVWERDIRDIKPAEIKHFAQIHFFAGIGGWPLALRMAGWPESAPVWTGSCPCQPFSVAGRKLGTDDPRHLWPIWKHLIAQCRPPVIFGEQVASPLGRAWLASVRDDLEALGYAVGAADLCAAGVGAPHIRQRIWFGAVRLADADSERRDWFGLRVQRWGSKEGGFETNWSSKIDWLQCYDGMARPTQSGLCPLADGIPRRVGRIRAYGNAIVPQVAAAFVIAFMDACFPCWS